MTRVERKARAGQVISFGDKDNPIVTLELIEVNLRTVRFKYKSGLHMWIADATSVEPQKSQQPPTGQPEAPQ